MEVKVLKPFEDLYKNVLRQVGEIITVNKERFAELEARLPGFVEEVGASDTQNEE